MNKSSSNNLKNFNMVAQLFNKQSKTVQNGHNYLKWLKMIQNYPKKKKLFKMV